MSSLKTYDDALRCVHELLPLIRQYAGEAEELRRQPKAVVEAVVASGLVRLLLPQADGGAELGVTPLVSIIIELAKGDASVAWNYACAAVHNALTLYFSQDVQNEVWARGKDVLIATSFAAQTARPVEGGYSLQGTWPWASGVDDCSWSILLALVPGEPPEPRLFFVPASQYTIIDDWDVIGMQGTGSKTIAITTDLLVPAYRTARLSDILQASGLSAFIPSLVAPLVGATEGAYEEWLTWAEHARTKGGEELSSFSHIQIEVGEIDSVIHHAKSLLLAAAQSITNDSSQQAMNLRDCAKAVELACNAITRIFRISGAGVIQKGHPIQKRWRDIHAMSVHAAFNRFRTQGNVGRLKLNRSIQAGWIF